MGYKQKIKQARHGQGQGKKIAPPEIRKPARMRWGWIIAVGVAVAAILGTAAVMFFQNKDRLIRTAVLAQAYDVEDHLNAQAGRFTTEDSRQMRDLLRQVHEVGNTPPLEARVAGQLKFVLSAMDEIIRDGNLEAGEIQKLQMLISAAQQFHQRSGRREQPTKP